MLACISGEKCISELFLFALTTHLIFFLWFYLSKKKKQKFLWFGFYRENGSSMDGAESLNTNKSSFKASGDLKRKQSEVVSETQ